MSFSFTVIKTDITLTVESLLLARNYAKRSLAK